MAKKLSIKNCDDLRDVCTNTISDLVSGETTPANANAIFNGVGKIISTVKVEVEYSKVVGRFKGPLPLKVAQIKQIEGGKNGDSKRKI